MDIGIKARVYRGKRGLCEFASHAAIQVPWHEECYKELLQGQTSERAKWGRPSSRETCRDLCLCQVPLMISWKSKQYRPSVRSAKRKESGDAAGISPESKTAGTFRISELGAGIPNPSSDPVGVVCLPSCVQREIRRNARIWGCRRSFSGI